ncbi:MAG: YCF48-related protein, partial [Trebonia sp.]
PGNRGATHSAAAAHGAAGRLTLRSLAGEAMRGSLQSPVLAFGPAGTGVIAWTHSTSPNPAHPKSWLATTRNRGRSWDVGRRGFSLFSAPAFDGSRDGWAMVIDAHQALRFFASHDDGQRWVPARSAAAADSVPGDVSVAGGVVWAVGTGSCTGTSASCRWVVMRGPAAGDRLPATAAQPLAPTNQNATTISAASATTAYVTAPTGHGTVTYATHDRGRHWRQLPDQCSDGSTELGATATVTGSLWQICSRPKRLLVQHSTDAGTHWTSAPLPFRAPHALQPITGQVAWSQAARGTIYRTTDGGSSWQAVWHPGGPHGRSMPGASPILAAQSADDASLLVQLTTGPTSRDRIPHATNLIVYRTSDGGANWYPSVVKLPYG